MLSTYIFSPDDALPQVFDKTKDQKIICKDIKESWNSVLDLLVCSKSPIKWNFGPEVQNTGPYITHLPFLMMECHVVALHILHYGKHCVKQFKDLYFQEYSMGVKSR